MCHCPKSELWKCSVAFRHTQRIRFNMNKLWLADERRQSFALCDWIKATHNWPTPSLDTSGQRAINTFHFNSKTSVRWWMQGRTIRPKWHSPCCLPRAERQRSTSACTLILQWWAKHIQNTITAACVYIYIFWLYRYIYISSQALLVNNEYMKIII